MRIKAKTKREVRKKINKIIAAFLAINILFEAIAPTCAFALTGGPSQPEVQSFTPVGTSDMVNIFTGDFSYNIPLMDVDGYPINIGYSSGITMDQEASWVGLGWNISPGVINRGMRGLPDDFNGDEVVKELNMKPNRTYGLNVGADFELFGLKSLGAAYTLGIKYNNYNGYGVDQSFNLSLSSGEEGKGPLTGGLGINSSSEDGLTLQPSVGFSTKIGKNEKNSLSASVGSAINSRAGLKQLTISSSIPTVPSNFILGNKIDGSFDMGMATYTPSASFPMQNISITGNFKIGAGVFGAHPNFRVGGFYSGQKLATTTITNPAYGYMNADEGTKYDNALLDFNREKDGAFTQSTPALPVTNFTYDIYSLSGEGISGSYRPFRSDMGHVYDPKSYTTSDGYSVGAEIGVGQIFHVGVDVSVNNVDGYTGRWKKDNKAAMALTHKSTTNAPLFEKYYFKEASEKSVDADPAFYNKAGAEKAKSVYLNQLSKFNVIADKNYATIDNNNKYVKGVEISSENTRTKRERRNQPLTTISRGEYEAYAVQNFAQNNILNNYGTLPSDAKAHHIAEISALRNDGARYVYGIAAYNKKQEEVTFATGESNSGEGPRTGNLSTGLVKYNTGDNEVNSNVLGKDNFVSITKTPAYAHSYMLTAILSPDYVDSENNGTTTRGPSDGDIGSYTKFNYIKKENYKWRTPLGERMASYNEGLLSDKTDDKGNYIYGEKDLYYLESIETKNYIAKFILEDREDGYGAVDKNGKVASTNPMQLLRKIVLYPKFDYKQAIAAGKTPTPIKTVNFVYDYSLCKGVPNNKNGNGKLTLKEIYFTYQGSNKARLSPYKFNYCDPNHDGNINTECNPNYHIKGYDRWGNYKPSFDDNGNSLLASDYPYVEQDSALASKYVQSWTLTDVQLPSGGKIEVDYESDDYAYVQNKKAGQMFKVLDIVPASSTETTFSTPSISANSKKVNLDDPKDGLRLIIKLQDKFTTGNNSNWNDKFRKDYLGSLDYLYFRMFVRVQNNSTYIASLTKPTSEINRDEFISGYLVKINGLTGNKLYEKPCFDVSKSYVDPTGQYACIFIPKVDYGDGSSPKLSPISKAAVQYGRLNMSNVIWNTIAENETYESNDLEQIIKKMAESSFLKNIQDMINGANKSLFEKYNIGKEAFTNKSWVRLANPNSKKLGGGSRVKKIVISDEWDGAGISANASSANVYGQEYNYRLADGTSSGVASYEPQVGGDENPFKKPVFFNESKLLAPDDEHYMEEPFGESFFPSPSVGYSQVTVRNLKRDGVTRHATGKTVHSFYTAKDFPTIVERTDLKTKREKTNPFSITSLFKIKSRDYMTASQGYSIELNDMHGKPMKQEVFQEGQNVPISSVEYRYKSKPYLTGSARLDNKSTVLYSDGTVDNNATIGVFFDYVADMREATNETTSAAIAYNSEGFSLIIIPLVTIPVMLPSITNEKTQFRSAVITKVIQRFGILEETIAKDLGSTVSTKNIAYDAETGDVLLSETITNYNDKIYTLNYPAYWHYDGMGAAYKNVGFSSNNISISNGLGNVNNAMLYFAEGDEVSLLTSNGFIRGWVKQVFTDKIHVIDRQGNDVASATFVKILRSGRRNQQGIPMASITSLTNPLNNIQANIYENVLQAQATEFTNSWRTFCDCFQGNTSVYSDNPYIIGTKGMYKNKKSYTHLAGRTQSNYNDNTNIRKDGVMSSYSPFYKLNEGKWVVDSRNWTYTSEVTEFSPFGMELENKDALGRYSSATYGYAQSLPIATAANARYREIGFDNFEDYDYRTCADKHFKFSVAAKAGSPSDPIPHDDGLSSISTSGDMKRRSKKDKNQTTSQRSLYYEDIDNTEAHTGRYSLLVKSGNKINMLKQLSDCDANPCNLSVVQTGSGSAFCYEIKGGTAPYQYEWTTANCEVAVAISNTENKVCATINSGATIATCYLYLTVTDNNNCKKVFTLPLITSSVKPQNSDKIEMKAR